MGLNTLNMKNYSIADIVTTFNVSERTAQRWIETLVKRDGNKIIIPEDVFNLLKSRHLPDTYPTNPDIPTQEFDRVEYFTEEEYQEFHKRLVEYPLLKDRTESLLKDIEYHRKSISSKERQMELLLLAITNKKFIEE